MVGTSATRSPASRQAATWARIAATSLKRCGEEKGLLKALAPGGDGAMI